MISSLRQVAISSLFLGALCLGTGCVVHGRGGFAQIDIVGTDGYHHQGYYDDHHDWHGGYYDDHHQWHDDPHDWH